MKSLISTRDLSREDVERILNYAQQIKGGDVPQLEGDVALLFMEPSTRTRISFEKACRKLGLETYTVVGESSSMVKGESFFDTLKTFEALGFSSVVFRVPFVLFPYEDLVKNLSLSLVNAGDGTHQHPTQGLIDLFTLLEEFGSLEGLRVLYVGDITHSRVFRSGVHLLNAFGVKVSVCGPRTLIPREVKSLGVEEVFDDIDEALENSDAVIWLRLQKERQKENFIPSERSYFRQFGLTVERYEKLRGKFLHPGPVNREIDIDGRLMYSEKSLIQKQVENGLYVRMAVMRWCLE
ncbi:MAG: aspartate carbamoyltransferase catalytic subunit [Aquificae bacterium]|nr:aspartate carbamoyltransferase catalytic subunit [Aquificota bacterium]